MSVETYKEVDDFFRSMRQSFNSRDIKTFRSHFWTDKRFAHLDSSGRTDHGWGAFEEVLDQEFRYMDSIKMELKDLTIHTFGDSFATVSGEWKITQVDPGGRENESCGRGSWALVRMGGDWKIVMQHFSGLAAEDVPPA